MPTQEEYDELQARFERSEKNVILLQANVDDLRNRLQLSQEQWQTVLAEHGTPE